MTSSPKLCRSGQQRCAPDADDVTRGLREADYCQVHHSSMPLAEIAEDLGMTPNALADAVNPNGDGSMLASRHRARLLRLTPDNLITVSYLASLQNAVVCPLPDGTVDAETAAVVKEFGEFLIETAAARAGDVVTSRVTVEEADKIEREGTQAIQAIVAVIRRARLEAEGGDK